MNFQHEGSLHNAGSLHNDVMQFNYAWALHQIVNNELYTQNPFYHAASDEKQWITLECPKSIVGHLAAMHAWEFLCCLSTYSIYLLHFLDPFFTLIIHNLAKFISPRACIQRVKLSVLSVVCCCHHENHQILTCRCLIVSHGSRTHQSCSCAQLAW